MDRFFDLRARRDKWQWDQVMGYGLTHNLIIGGNTCGKSFQTLARIIMRHIKHGEEFFYVRRYETEFKPQIMYDMERVFPLQFRWQSNQKSLEIQYRPKESERKEDWVTCGYVRSLSKYVQEKGVPYPKVRWLMLEEFIIPTWSTLHYMRDDFNAFWGLYRVADGGENRVRTILLANAVDYYNPYFAGFDIYPIDGRRFVVNRDRDCVLQNYDNPLFREEFGKTNVGKLALASDMGNSAVDNRFYSDSAPNICQRPRGANYLFRLRFAQFSISVFRDRDRYWITSTLYEGGERYAIIGVRKKEGETTLPKNHPFAKAFQKMYHYNRVWFDSPMTHDALWSQIKYFGG